MPVTNDDLKRYGHFHLANPRMLDGFDECVLWLEAILHNGCSVFDKDGKSILIETKQLVDRIDGLRIVINPKEHAPPHFHVLGPDIRASFSIEDCRLLEGNVEAGILKKVRFWHEHCKPKLVEAWNATRPTDCTVGPYVGR